MSEIDADWLTRHPLPAVEDDTNKNARGRVLAAGGSTMVPGALRLTGEAALRAGAGKVQLATVDPAALLLGMAMPEAAVFGLPANEEGELAADAGGGLAKLLGRFDSLVLGPGMGEGSAAAPILRRVLASDEAAVPMVIDAAAIAGARGCAEGIRSRGKVVLTPHPGEMAALMECDDAEVRDRPTALATRAAERFGAVVVLKQAETWIAAPGEEALHYRGGGPGLATAGSGDVLAGILGGLLARGTAPSVAAGWAVWLHGEAGRSLARRGSTGFLAREIAGQVPALMERHAKP
ncbi:NAD(P)H-hydrate dehydratase [Sphingomonas sp. Sphisp140]|uniref:NAD(P)H-hydrate dehydratase n=1 Tax=unclassified Sphingomonas TaxID=196159 RepID=UPI0039AFA81D